MFCCTATCDSYNYRCMKKLHRFCIVVRSDWTARIVHAVTYWPMNSWTWTVSRLWFWWWRLRCWTTDAGLGQDELLDHQPQSLPSRRLAVHQTTTTTVHAAAVHVDNLRHWLEWDWHIRQSINRSLIWLRPPCSTQNRQNSINTETQTSMPICHSESQISQSSTSIIRKCITILNISTVNVNIKTITH